MKNKVVFSLLDSPAYGGAEQYLFSHLRYLNKKGFDILLATNNDRVKELINSGLSPLEKEAFLVIDSPYRLDAIGNIKGLIKYFISLPRALIWTYFTIKRLKRDYKNVVCLWPGFSDRLSFSPIAKFQKCIIIWIEIGPLDPTFKKTFGFPKLLYVYSQRFASFVITTSLFSKKSILKNTKFKEKDIEVIYPGVKHFSGSEISEFKRARKLEEKNIVIVARLAKENEISMAIKGFGLFLKNNPQSKHSLLIVGEGPEKTEFQELTIKLNLQKRINFTGFVTEEKKNELIATSSLLIFPRAWELDGFGITTIEALSLGVPVLTSDFGPQIEIITDGVEGFRYKPHDEIDLARKIEKMIKLSPEARNKMKENALKRSRDFSENESNRKMLDVIENQLRLHISNNLKN